jgi:hypothetical protein
MLKTPLSVGEFFSDQYYAKGGETMKLPHELLPLVPMVVAYTIEWILLRRFGQEPKFLFSAIDPKAGVTGGWLFALWLVAGNFINSFMEERLFRGVMLNFNRIRPVSYPRQVKLGWGL